MINWTHWHNEPYLVAGLILAGWLYALLAGPWRKALGGGVFPGGPAVRFYSGLLIFYLTVGSPLDQVGERYLFWAHMIQHLLLVYPAALLVLSGIPSWMIRPITGQPVLRRILRVMTQPVVAGLIYIVVLSAWHVPGLYDLALRDKAVHILQHLSFFLSAMLMWWPIASPSKELPPLPYGAQIIYIFFVGLLQVPALRLPHLFQGDPLPNLRLCPAVDEPQPPGRPGPGRPHHDGRHHGRQTDRVELRLLPLVSDQREVGWSRFD